MSIVTDAQLFNKFLFIDDFPCYINETENQTELSSLSLSSSSENNFDQHSYVNNDFSFIDLYSNATNANVSLNSTLKDGGGLIDIKNKNLLDWNYDDECHHFKTNTSSSSLSSCDKNLNTSSDWSYFNPKENIKNLFQSKKSAKNSLISTSRLFLAYDFNHQPYLHSPNKSSQRDLQMKTYFLQGSTAELNTSMDCCKSRVLNTTHSSCLLKIFMRSFKLIMINKNVLILPIILIILNSKLRHFSLVLSISSAMTSPSRFMVPFAALSLTENLVESVKSAATATFNSLISYYTR